MRKYLVFLFMGIFVASLNHAGASSGLEDKNLKRAIQMLKKNGISTEEVTIDKSTMEWQSTCDDNEGEDNPDIKKEGFLFEVIVKKPIKIVGLNLNKGTSIRFCHDKVMWLQDNFNAKGERVNFEKDGFSCSLLIGLTHGGRLCTCVLGKDTLVDGFLVPANSRMTLKLGKPYAFIFPMSDPRVKDFLGSFFAIEKSKPVPLKSENIRCDFFED
ncbi:MAG: hypothetical protein HUU57_17025 [Bdellovibrio sp.]|nr:hypothetical protein [Bdellovibrio sp.]